MIVSASDLGYRYPGAAHPTLTGLDFEIREGEVFGFLGPNGSGKSTTQKLLARILHGHTGDVRIFGEPLADVGAGFYDEVGVCFEFPNLYEKLSAIENLEFHRAFFSGESDAPKTVLERLDLPAGDKRPVSTYSKGMKMRVVLALALGSSLVPTAVGIGVQALALSPGWGLLWLAPPLLLTATFCGLTGVALSGRHAEFTGYLVGSFIPAMALLSLPFFSYFGVVPRAALVWVPTDGGLFGFANSLAQEPKLATLCLSVAALLFWNVLALHAAARGFERSVGRSVA